MGNVTPLSRYLSCVVHRHGLPSAIQEDFAQAVCLEWLETLGRDPLTAMLTTTHRRALTDHLSIATETGRNLRRAIWRVTKRLQREFKLKVLPIETWDVPGRYEGIDAIEFEDAITTTLTAKELPIIRSRLTGDSVNETAARLGMDRRTVWKWQKTAGEKLRAISYDYRNE